MESHHSSAKNPLKLSHHRPSESMSLTETHRTASPLLPVCFSPSPCPLALGLVLKAPASVFVPLSPQSEVISPRRLSLPSSHHFSELTCSLGSHWSLCVPFANLAQASLYPSGCLFCFSLYHLSQYVIHMSFQVVQW